MDIPGLAAVRLHPSLDDPRAIVYLRQRQPVDVWSLCEKLRGQSVEVLGIEPRESDSFRLRIELARWQVEETGEVTQCLVCRQTAASVVEALPWVEGVDTAGGGINFHTKERGVDLVDLINAVRQSGIAPRSVWYIPDGAAMPKAAPPRLVLTE